MKMTLQEYANHVLSETYKQQLISAEMALEAHGWHHCPQEFKPWCCGQPVESESFIGSVYHLECAICGNFVHDMTGPSFENAFVSVIDSQKVDCEAQDRFIVGKRGQ